MSSFFSALVWDLLGSGNIELKLHSGITQVTTYSLWNRTSVNSPDLNIQGGLFSPLNRFVEILWARLKPVIRWKVEETKVTAMVPQFNWPMTSMKYCPKTPQWWLKKSIYRKKTFKSSNIQLFGHLNNKNEPSILVTASLWRHFYMSKYQGQQWAAIPLLK